MDGEKCVEFAAFLYVRSIMTNLLYNIVKEFDRLRQPPLFIWWDRWNPDKAWAEYFLQCGSLGSITKLEFKRSFQNLEFYKMIFSAGEERNDVGVGMQFNALQRIPNMRNFHPADNIRHCGIGNKTTKKTHKH